MASDSSTRLSRFGDAASGDYATAWSISPSGKEVVQGTVLWQRALLAASLAIPLLTALVLATYLRSAAITEAQDDGERAVVALERHAAGVLDTHLIILRQLDILTHGRTTHQIRNDELIERTFSEFKQNLTQVVILGVSDADGQVITNSLDAAREGASLATQEHFLVHMR